jgi:hypothetical protein
LERLASSSTAVKQRIIRGEDIVNLLARQKVTLKIQDAKIEGGLNFSIPIDEGGPSTESLAPIESSLEITDTEIEGQVLLRDRIFKGEFIVTSSVFRGLLDLYNSTFKQKVEFRNCIFKDNFFCQSATFFELQLKGSTFEGLADFQLATFLGVIDLNGTQWKTDCSFNFANLETEAHFENNMFEGPAYFAGTHFKGFLNLSGSAFQQDAVFTGATFQSDLDGRRMKCEKRAHFSKAEFQGETTLSEAKFGQNADFSGAIFYREASFSEAKFGQNADFSSAEFHADANFSKATFQQNANFSIVQCLGQLEMSSCTYGNIANFSKSNIATLQCRENARFMGDTSFLRATISTLIVEDTEFNGEADFSGATFGPSSKPKRVPFPIQFKALWFKETVHFSAANFRASTLFENIKFSKTANFSGVTFNRDPDQRYRFIRFDFTDLRVRWQDMPDPELWEWAGDLAEEKERKSEVLKSLESLFRKNGQLSDANDIFYHRMDIELTEQRDTEPLYKWLPSQIFWYFCKGLCGYGTSLWLILFWCIVIDLSFTLIYYKIEPQRLPLSVPQADNTFRLRLLDFPRSYFADGAAAITQRKPLEKFWDAFLLSTVLLIKIGYRDTKIKEGSLFGRPNFLSYKNIVRVEWGLGYILLAAFVITLSNTFPLVNRLLSGVF